MVNLILNLIITFFILDVSNWRGSFKKILFLESKHFSKLFYYLQKYVIIKIIGQSLYSTTSITSYLKKIMLKKFGNFINREKY